MKTILLFIDGLGWGPPDAATNPQYSYGGTYFRLPVYNQQPIALTGGGFAAPIDAVLGVDGVPQSATGQTTLFSGVNAQQAIGKHLTGFPNVALQNILREHSILKSITDLGYKARFLNAFRPRFWELSEERKWTLSASTVTTLAAKIPFFNLDDIKAGHSVYQEFTNRELIERGFDMEPMTPSQAGGIVGRQINHYDFILYEYFQTDKAGHSGDQRRCEEQLTMLDAFMAELISEAPPEALVLLTSDHGNLEDATTRRHTRNPVPMMAWGTGAAEFIGPIKRLDQVAPAILARYPG